MYPNPDDARRAVIALILGQANVQFGDYRLEPAGDRRVCLRYPHNLSGWSLCIDDDKLTWWPAFRASLGHEMAINALEDLRGHKLEYYGPYNEEYEIIGPLGLAALRAHLSTTNPIA